MSTKMPDVARFVDIVALQVAEGRLRFHVEGAHGVRSLARFLQGATWSVFCEHLEADFRWMQARTQHSAVRLWTRVLVRFTRWPGCLGSA